MLKISIISINKYYNLCFPEELLTALDLTIYAVTTRYPSFEEEISEQEYKEAIEIAEKVYDWVENLLGI